MGLLPLHLPPSPPCRHQSGPRSECGCPLRLCITPASPSMLVSPMRLGQLFQLLLTAVSPGVSLCGMCVCVHCCLECLCFLCSHGCSIVLSVFICKTQVQRKHYYEYHDSDSETNQVWGSFWVYVPVGREAAGILNLPSWSDLLMKASIALLNHFYVECDTFASELVILLWILQLGKGQFQWL